MLSAAFAYYYFCHRNIDQFSLSKMPSHLSFSFHSPFHCRRITIVSFQFPSAIYVYFSRSHLMPYPMTQGVSALAVLYESLLRVVCSFCGLIKQLCIDVYFWISLDMSGFEKGIWGIWSDDLMCDMWCDSWCCFLYQPRSVSSFYGNIYAANNFCWYN